MRERRRNVNERDEKETDWGLQIATVRGASSSYRHTQQQLRGYIRRWQQSEITTEEEKTTPSPPPPPPPTLGDIPHGNGWNVTTFAIMPEDTWRMDRSNVRRRGMMMGQPTVEELALCNNPSRGPGRGRSGPMSYVMWMRWRMIGEQWQITYRKDPKQTFWQCTEIVVWYF